MADQPKISAKAEEKQVVEKQLVEKIIKPEKRELKEIKEKPEKIEHKEKPEKIEFKEKPEKYEHKEKPEKYEHKEKPEKVEQLEKNIPDKFLLENAPDPTGNPGGPIEQRVAALEASVASLYHFITTELRPDLSRGALSSEPAAKKSGG
jgi:hypothetical protein